MSPAHIAFHEDTSCFNSDIWAFEPRGARSEIDEISASELFDAGYYRLANPDLDDPALDAIVHYHQVGWREGRRPNPYFDPTWYIENYLDVRDSAVDPLLHYIRDGEREGRRPVLYFDPVWYRTAHDVPAATLCLAHFLPRRTSGEVSPLAEFNSKWYLRNYPDVAQAGMDPLEHYLVQGFREVRDPSPQFDARYYKRRYLRYQPDENPLLHYLKHRTQPGITPTMPPGETSIPREVARNTGRHSAFETFRPLPERLPRRARLLAFYLPQFHTVAENNAWWGEGFTEWTNLARGLPRFAGHYQPRIPRDLGHYRLEGVEILRRQTSMARQAGLSGFVFYFYWFNGRRLLERPLETFLADQQNDFPFCLMWTNENWTRRWDGSENEVLISQDYRDEHEAALLATFARHFADSRYIRLEGRPLLMIYRPALIPAAGHAIARWRRLFRERHGEEPIFVMSQSFGDADPTRFGMDGAVEFPPHKLVESAGLINDQLDILDDAFTAQVYDYADITARSLGDPTPGFPLIRTIIPGWDNDARRQGAGLVVHGATPAAYQSWLERLIVRAQQAPFFGETLICINAWNEWAEGAYLEPDVHFGAAFLNATGRAAAGLAPPSAAPMLLLVGHDAFPAGAQLLLLHIGRHLVLVHGIAIEFLLLGDGALRPQYEALANVTVMADAPALDAHLAGRHSAGLRAALVNSAAAAWICPRLAGTGISATMLVHELPGLLAEKSLADAVRSAALAATRLIFAADCVLARFRNDIVDHPATVVVTQGLYRPVAYQPTAGARLRRQLGIASHTTLAIGIGYADLRKGFDIFLQVWRAVRRRESDVHLLWAGAIDGTLRAYLDREIQAATATGSFHMLGWRDDIADLLSAADVFLLTSREDPYPAVALEALSAGLPVLGFDGSGGFADLLAAPPLCAAGCATLPMADADAMARQIVEHPPRRETATVCEWVRTTHDFATYIDRVLYLARPDLLRISVVVPSYNYARYLRTRLATIFAQTYPVLEIIFLDDASSDESVATARGLAQEWHREIRVIENAASSGSVFAQWAKAAEVARGDFIWIAEADDASAPLFLERLAAAIRGAPGAVFAFSDSRCVDAQDRPTRSSYRDYYAQAAGPGALAQDENFSADAFLRRFLAERNLILNASAVLWRREALRSGLARCGDELRQWHLAGDWRIYAEVLSTSSGSVAYVAEALNTHRRHEASATHRLGPAAHVAEISRMHRLLRERLPDDPSLKPRQSAYVKSVRRELGLPRANRQRSSPRQKEVSADDADVRR
jgi:glycosyltransferase involved in cell wall biosynthesis